MGFGIITLFTYLKMLEVSLIRSNQHNVGFAKLQYKSLHVSDIKVALEEKEM